MKALNIVGVVGHAAQEEVDLHLLANTLLEVVDDTMQPDQVSLWIR